MLFGNRRWRTSWSWDSLTPSLIRMARTIFVYLRVPFRLGSKPARLSYCFWHRLKLLVSRSRPCLKSPALVSWGSDCGGSESKGWIRPDCSALWFRGAQESVVAIAGIARRRRSSWCRSCEARASLDSILPKLATRLFWKDPWSPRRKLCARGLALRQCWG